jgi:hypothetical protein
LLDFMILHSSIQADRTHIINKDLLCNVFPTLLPSRPTAGACL